MVRCSPPLSLDAVRQALLHSRRSSDGQRRRRRRCAHGVLLVRGRVSAAGPFRANDALRLELGRVTHVELVRTVQGTL